MKKLAVALVAGLVVLGGAACEPTHTSHPHSTRWTPPKSGTLQHGVHPTKTKKAKTYKAPKSRKRR
jgi:hypothetical protein